jgi:hypothetical protein
MSQRNSTPKQNHGFGEDLVFCANGDDYDLVNSKIMPSKKGKNLLSGCHPSSFVVLQVVSMHYLVLS